MSSSSESIRCWLLHLLAFVFLMNPCSPAAAAFDYCYSTGNFTSGSDYESNRNGFLTFAIPDEVGHNSGFFYTKSVRYSNTSDVVHCLGLCRLDLINTDSCSICVSNSSHTIINNCPAQKEVIAWGDDAGCIVRCAPHPFSKTYETEPKVHICNTTDVLRNNVTQFGHTLANLTHSIAKRAAAQGSLSSFASDGETFPKYFATEELNLAASEKMYALGFCLPTLSDYSCSACLQAAANQSDKNCKGKQGAIILMPSCILRYELYRFYKPMFVSSLPSPRSVPSHPTSSLSSIKKEGRGRRRLESVIVLVTAAAAVGAISFMICIVKHYFKKRKKYCRDEGGAESMDSCLEYRLNTIQVATDDFSPSNKLGRGGFGVVYKGRLPNGQLIAVKRLAGNSPRGEMEFRNEVQLVATLHHKDLIRLIGFCLSGNDRILIYELAVNGSLDHFLFDPIRREQLAWETRYNIIEGIARGMLYLHEESQLRIIHRDLKASNILLDEYMNPKISDFGTARLFVEDQEYFKHGKISVKIDVFSFGVLLLEIVSGKRNSGSENQRNIEHLLSKAWKYWTRRKYLLLIDPVLLRAIGQVHDIARCIHIALLCVQEKMTHRPTMNSVILMLEGCSQSLPSPSKPAYFMDFKDDELEDHSVATRQELQPNLGQATSLISLSSNDFSSINEISISQPYPEAR